MRKIIILIFLNFVANSLYSQQVVTCNDSIRESLVYSYYENSNFLTHNFDYELMLKKRKLMKRSSDVSSLGYATSLGMIVLNSILAVNNNWNVWIDVPLATTISIACAYPFIKYHDNLEMRANAIPEYASAIRQNGDSLYTLMTEMSLVYKNKYGASSWQYADCLLWCAMLCANFGDNKQACNLRDQALLLFNESGDGLYEISDTIHKIFLHDLDSKLKYNSGCDLAAVQEKKKATELKRSFFGEDSEVYLQSLLDVSQLFSERLRYRKSFLFHKTANVPYVEKIKSEFCNRSESERTMYWTEASKYIDRTIALNYNYSHKHIRRNNAMSEAAYDALLLRKGLLLNTTLEFERFINASNNAEAIKHLKQKKLLAANRAPSSVLDSMDYAILADLQTKNQKYDIPHLAIGWKDVQKQLAEDDLAIEFYKTIYGDYGAIMLKKAWPSPKSVKLVTYCKAGKKQTHIDSLLTNKLLELDEISVEAGQILWNVSKAIWTDEIIKYFPTTKKGKVYFSPDGNQQIVGIEFLPFVKPRTDGESITEYYTIADMYNVYRLSSTRELAVANKKTGKDAIAYGGLDYGLSSEAMEEDTKNYGGKRGGVKSKRGSLNTYWENLDATKDEAIEITRAINQAHRDSLVAVAYTGQLGTESSFKDLSEKNMKVIHIATHGYYDSVNLDSEDPLESSGLCFSGANNRYNVAESSEDGVLTAKEVSTMNLNGLSLLTLSACETGLGSISTDGVFGLQRGFKMAGAKSILMSLWKVDDAATCKLMTEFYTNWISKDMTKHDALEAAKKTIRNTKGWDDPKYWAAFVLLDGLD